MNFMEFESPQKLRGGYYTQADVAAFLTRWVLELRPRKVLEPSCGDGVFLHALARLGAPDVTTVVGCEINPVEAVKARAVGDRLEGVSVEVHAQDFLLWSLSRLQPEPDFDAVLGNPPFIRYQYLDSGLQARAEQIFRNFGLTFTKHTNAWVPFVVASLAMLRPGGRLAMVVPSELLHVLHARSLRRFLLEQCSKVLLIDPEDIWFDDTLQGVVLLLAQKSDRPRASLAEVAITAVKNRQALTRSPGEYFGTADYFPGTVLNGKWMLGLLTNSERTLFERLGSHPAVKPLVEIASVDVGIVTGANKFFLVPDAAVREHGLKQWAHPMFGRSEHVRGVVYDTSCHEENRGLGLPTNFLWFGETRLSELTASARRYILLGESQGLHRRYKCRIRNPWYNVPSVYPAPVGMLKRSHHFPRLILNTANAYTTDTAYRVVPKNVKAADVVQAFVNSLTALSAELEGRHYGGGVLELVPSEIERVLIPMWPSPPPSALADLDRAVRSNPPPEELLARQDAVVLRPLGISKQECEGLLSAWVRVRHRRQRTAMTASEVEDQED